MSNIVVASDPADVHNGDASAHRGLLGESEDMLADLAISESAVKPPVGPLASDGADTGNEKVSSVADSVAPASAVTEAPAEPGTAALGLTPGEDAAAAECAEEFVELYENVSR